MNLMNKRAYYYDSYTIQFDATVIERLIMDDHQAVVLDKTFFYPTSGGQPCDKGKINGTTVVDVQIRPADGAIVHMLKREIEGDHISGAIDWEHRFNHMQHHTGQHILSQAFVQVANAQTVGFHLSDASITIDLDRTLLSTDEIDAAEHLANQVVWQNRPVTVQEVSMEQARNLPLRKIPPAQDGKLRLVDIEDFDLTACGGTHVSQTGEVGLIKIIKQEKRGEKQRIEFRCGNRALNDYQQKQEAIARLTARLTTGITELDSAVERLQDDNKIARKQLKKQLSTISRLEANSFIEQASWIGETAIVARVFSDRDPGQVRALGSQLIRHDGVIALLGAVAERSHLIFSRSADAPGQMNTLLKTALEILGSNSGGGSTAFAQGVGPAIDGEQLKEAIDAAKKQLLEEIRSMG